MFQLPPLPYDLTDLEPFLSPFQIYIHYYRHHKAYVDNLNKLLVEEKKKGNHSFDGATLYQVIMTSLKEKNMKIYHNASQHYNHAFYWDSMAKPKVEEKDANQIIKYFDQIDQLSPTAKKMLRDRFGTLQQFEKEFIDVAGTMFGSGYVWLVIHPETGDLAVITTKDGDLPQIYKLFPLLNLDLWEHAYYLDYVFQRQNYVTSFLPFVNWAFVSKNMDDYFALQNKKLGS
jgi:Fe-Mn family superoxide dismutase